ncbi:type IX secretion system membrane protein PorP/SprF [Pedobacter sp. ASV28]|uniref:PorP/SprF family type IX secretion system membrane protein n=1 Tax=Pedobacter sp. ASV28 TaxID=2795123 RepID=UPI001E3C33D8|nr:type IX secretion system membrane protein PorP/SprF [Pedobacter sp. ASV28]
MKRNLYTHILALAMVLIALRAGAQLGPMSAQYFQNPYLANPAMAGVNQGLEVSLGYRSQWTKIPGAPEQQALTLGYGKNRTGWGINLYLDRAGLQRQLRALASYAYHLPISTGQALHFGLSVGISQQRLSLEDVQGRPDDLSAQRYNDREAYLDGDFGIAYTYNGFRLEAALPNLDRLLRSNRGNGLVDVATFYAAAGYRLDLTTDQNMQLEPKVAYRGVKGFDSVVDAGAAFWFEDGQLMLSVLYHSSKSATFGLGMDLKGKYRVMATYTTQTSALGSYANGSFELGLGIRLGK